MPNMFGNLFISKEERQQKYEAYSKRIFPYGDKQREIISFYLSELFPKEKLKYLLMHYILIKESVIGDEQLDIQMAAKKIGKKKIIRVTPELQELMIALLKADLAIDESLKYPSIIELKNSIDRVGRDI